MSEDTKGQVDAADVGEPAEAAAQAAAKAQKAEEAGIKAAEEAGEIPSDGELPDQAARDLKKAVELDELDEFMFKGKKYTPEQFDNERLMQSDYTKKTQAISEERKFFANLESDLAAVKENPHLAADFKNIYPERFHNYLDLVHGPSQSKAIETDDDKAAELSDGARKKLDELEKRVAFREIQAKEREVQATVKHLDAVFETLQQKYPYAIDDAVSTRGMQLMEKHQGDPEFKMTDRVWERLFKQDNERNQARFEANYKKMVDEQLAASKKGADTGPGGSAPGQPPKRRSFAEATEDAIKDLRAKMS
jgi:hypothetical protein